MRMGERRGWRILDRNHNLKESRSSSGSHGSQRSSGRRRRQSTYEGHQMVVPVMSETSALLLLVGLFLAAMSKFYMLNSNTMRGIISVIVGSNSCPWCSLVCILLFPLWFLGLVGAQPKVVLLWVHSSTHTAASVSERFTRKETSGGGNCCFNTGSWSVNPSCCICRHEMEFYGRLWWNGSLGDCTSICK
jgi:hypothetical protein